MIILHAGMDDGRLLLWGETPAEPPPSKPGRKPRQVEPQRLPYDVGPGGLAAAFMEALPGRALPGGGGEPPFVWLPTAKGKPIPSSGLIADVDPEGAALAPWIVTALPLPTVQAIELLCACVGKDRLASGMMIGPTLAYWTRVLRFAGALLAREQIIPGVSRNGAGWRATWQPVLAGPEARRLTQLARGMPPACRALGRSREAPPDRAASVVLEAFLRSITDPLVRLGMHGFPSTSRGGRVAVVVTEFPSLHDRWVHALQTPDGLLDAPENDLVGLAEQVRAWQRPLTVAAASPFQLCFRLEEPPEDLGESSRERWYVQFMLQARDDQSLLIPVAEAWRPRGRVASVFEARHFEPREYLLTSLGQAAALCPPIENSLKNAAPGGFGMDTPDAHRFLTETAWLLEQAGYGMFLPSWWTRRGTKSQLGVRAEIHSPAMTGAGGMSLDQLVRFDWRAALGGESLTLEELEALTRLKTPLVRVRGQW